MKKLCLLLVCLLLAAGAHAQHQNARVVGTDGSPQGRSTADIAPVHYQNVLVVGWDGADYRKVHEMLVDGKLPTLWQLTNGGAGLACHEISGMSVTRSSWATIFSGYKYNDTHCYTNQDYAPITPGWTWMERLQYKRFDTVFVSSKGTMTGIHEGGPFYNMGRNIDYAWSEGCEHSRYHDRHVMPALQTWVPGGERFAIGIIYREPDRYGHQFGCDSPEYEQGIIQNDADLAEILGILAAEGVLDQTFVVVCSDHGFQFEAAGEPWGPNGPNQHNHAPFGFIANNAYMIQGDRILNYDLAPTVFDALGLDYSGYMPWLHGRSFAK